MRDGRCGAGRRGRRRSMGPALRRSGRASPGAVSSPATAVGGHGPRASRPTVGRHGGAVGRRLREGRAVRRRPARTPALHGAGAPRGRRSMGFGSPWLRRLGCVPGPGRCLRSHREGRGAEARCSPAGRLGVGRPTLALPGAGGCLPGCQAGEARLGAGSGVPVEDAPAGHPVEHRAGARQTLFDVFGHACCDRGPQLLHLGAEAAAMVTVAKAPLAVLPNALFRGLAVSHVRSVPVSGRGTRAPSRRVRERAGEVGIVLFARGLFASRIRARQHGGKRGRGP